MSLLTAVLTKLVRCLAAILASNGGVHPVSKATHEQVGSCRCICCLFNLTECYKPLGRLPCCIPSMPCCPVSMYCRCLQACLSAAILYYHCRCHQCPLQVLEVLTQTVLPAMSLIPGNAGALHCWGSMKGPECCWQHCFLAGSQAHLASNG